MFAHGQGYNEAAPCFGLGHTAIDSTSFARPRITCLFDPGRHKHSHDSHSLALGYDVKPLQGKLVKATRTVDVPLRVISRLEEVRILEKMYPQWRADCKNYNDCLKLVGEVLSSELRNSAKDRMSVV